MKKSNSRLPWIKYFLLFAIYLCSHLFTYSQDLPIEKQIETEFKALQQISFEQQTTLQIDRSPNSSSEEKTTKGILIFNLPELIRITNAIGKQYQRDIIRLVIAHELGHQIQYRTLGNIKGGLVYECQADIIAGYLIFSLLGQENGAWQVKNRTLDATDARYQKKLEEWTDRFNASLAAIFKSGSDYSLNRSHPTNNERLLSLRDGYAYGTIWLFGDFMENDPVLSRSVTAPSMRATCERFKSLLGFLPDDNLVTWSYRHASKIIHSFLPNSKDIVVYTNWDVDSTNVNCYLTYTQQITNTGNKRITFSYYNQVYSTKPEDPTNTIYWSLLATGNHSITLGPKETRSIQGSLEYLITNKFRTTFVYPGKEGALYSCTTLSDKAADDDDMVSNNFSGGRTQSDENILDAFISSRDLLDSFIGGTGITYTQGSVNTISYLSRLQISAASSTNIVYDRTLKRYSLEANYYHGSQKTNALKSVQDLTQLLTKRKYAVKEITTNTNSQERKWEIQDKQNVMLGIIVMNYSPSFKEYEITLVVYGLQ